MRVAIHQPNFVPWYPFFQKMESADLFVLLCRCQFEKGKYQNRFRFQDQWYTMSVYHGMQPIKDKSYSNPKEDWERIKRKLPQFAFTLSRFDDLISGSLEQTNVRIILRMAEMLGIKTEIVYDPITSLTGTDRLVEICKINDADTYLAGQSGANYMDPQKFADAGIKVEYQDLSKADKRHTFEVLHERL